MENIFTYVVLGIVGATVLTVLILFLVKFFKMTPDEKKDVIVQFLIGLVTIAETEFVGQGRGVEKIEWVTEQFNKTAPWFLKLILFFTKSANLNELVEKALDKAKDTIFDKYKNEE